MKELKKQWKNKEFKNCYLFYGAERFLIANYEKTLMEELLPTGAEMMNLDILEEKKVTAEKIMDSAETFPFMNEKRLILVRNSGFFQKGAGKEEGEKLLSYFENLPDTACILFVEDKVEKNIRLYKAVTKYGEAVEFKTPTEKDLVAWLKRECKNAGLSLETGVAHLFLQTVSPNMEAMHQEIQKLIAYKDGEGEILAEDVRQVCVASLESKVFDMVRAVVENNPQKALQIYHDLLVLNESPHGILALIIRQFRLILETTLLNDAGAMREEISAKLGIQSFAISEYLRHSKRFPVEICKRALADCLQTDVKMKTGIMTAEFAVEMLIVKYSSVA